MSMELKRAVVADSELKTVKDDLVHKWMAKNPEVRGLYPVDTRAELEKLLDEQLEALRTDTTYVSTADDGTEYQIVVRPGPSDTIHLSIKRKDREICRDWRHLQEIKNLLVGPECEGVELFPAESRVVDVANQTHLWCYGDERFRVPVGWDASFKSSMTVGKSKQRPREEES
jgi:hypothetical protein